MRLQGELGNQLFQFAMGQALTRRLGCPLRFDLANHDPTLAHCIGDAFVLASDADLLRVAELRDTPLEQWVRSLQLRAWLPLRRRRGRPERRLESRDAFGMDTRLDELVAPCFVRGYFQCVELFAEVLDDVIDQVLAELGEARRPRLGRRRAPRWSGCTSGAATTYPEGGSCPWPTTTPPWIASTSSWDRSAPGVRRRRRSSAS